MLFVITGAARPPDRGTTEATSVPEHLARFDARTPPFLKAFADWKARFGWPGSLETSDIASASTGALNPAVFRRIWAAEGAVG